MTATLRLVVTDRRDPLAVWREPVERFLKAMKAADRSPGTIRLRGFQLEQLGQLFPDPWAVTEDDLIDWLANPAWSAETRKSNRSCVQTFYRWAVRRKLVAESPAEWLEPVRVPRAVPRPVDEQTIDLAIAAATDKERLMVVLGGFAGLRAKEIARVHPKRDVVEDGRTLHVKGKGGRERFVPLHPVVLAELAAELRRRASGDCGTGFRYFNLVDVDGYLFPGNRPGKPVGPDNVSRVLSRILGRNWTGHNLRHRFATQALATSHDLRAVQELLGHSKPETTARYTAVPDEAMRTAVLGIGNAARGNG